ncbi:hypothetical protein ACOI1C_00375 [Bacillus sp. DJP31]|uniref:hypothetical protein n=1 Tax=Bacillus sp. DJP31 TaxID=3409789 RepID=UPI003BB4D9A2
MNSRYISIFLLTAILETMLTFYFEALGLGSLVLAILLSFIITPLFKIIELLKKR